MQILFQAYNLHFCSGLITYILSTTSTNSPLPVREKSSYCDAQQLLHPFTIIHLCLCNILYVTYRWSCYIFDTFFYKLPHTLQSEYTGWQWILVFFFLITLLLSLEKINCLIIVDCRFVTLKQMWGLLLQKFLFFDIMLQYFN